MKKSVKVAFGGIVSAIVCIIMAASLIPNVTFAAPAVAGLMLIAVFAEAGAVYAAGGFIASGILSFFISNKTSWLLFVLFFGFYPIVKPFIEKIKSPAVKWLAKFLLFNASAVAVYLVGILIMGVSIAKWAVITAFALGNIAFVLYDIAVSRVAVFYYLRIHERLSPIINKYEK